MLLCSYFSIIHADEFRNFCRPDPICKKKLDEAVHHRNSGEPLAALNSYKEAFSIQRDPMILFNMGVLYYEISEAPERAKEQVKYSQLSLDTFLNLDNHHAQFLSQFPEQKKLTQQAIVKLRNKINSATSQTSDPRELAAETQPQNGAAAVDPTPIALKPTPTFPLAPKPRSVPLYRRWWPWFGGGALLTGAAVIGIAIYIQGPSLSGVPVIHPSAL